MGSLDRLGRTTNFVAARLVAAYAATCTTDEPLSSAVDQFTGSGQERLSVM